MLSLENEHLLLSVLSELRHMVSAHTTQGQTTKRLLVCVRLAVTLDGVVYI